MEQNNVKTSPKDFFLHLLSVITLYVSAGSVIGLLFIYADKIFVDPLESSYLYYNGYAYAVRWPIALLIVVFPAYAWSVWYLNKGYSANPEKKELRVRKWLLFLTLFLAGGIIIGDLVTLVYNFLGGDLTARFISKIAATLVVAGAAFGYYLSELKQNYGLAKLIGWASAAIVVLSVGYGFFVAGSPFEARIKKFDQARVSDLQNTQSQIVEFWRQKERLPETLDELSDSISGYKPPTDPESLKSYDYVKGEELSFELCAEFSLPSSGDEAASREFYYAYQDDNWDHEAGRQCFKRTIDPERYPPYEKVPLR